MSTPAENIPYPEFRLHHRLALTIEDGRATVDEMVEEFECHRNTILNWTKGRSTPRRRDVRDWALRTGVPFDWLWTGRIDEGGAPDGGLTGGSTPLATVTRLPVAA